ncbi:MAG: sulfatase, partial [Mucinivorans sp.]
MKKIFFILPIALCSAVAQPVSGATKSVQQTATVKRPNLLFIIADQWRGRALGFMGVEPVQTPNLDKLAASGVCMTQAVSGYPVSSPARAMLLSGAYPDKNGVLANCNSNTSPQNVELRQDIVCWSDVLKGEGYATGYIGKWHMDKLHAPFVDCANNRGQVAWNEWCEPSRRHGFDYWTAYGTYDRHLRPMYWNTDASRDEFYYVDQWGPEYEADLATEFIRSRAAQSAPWALMVSMNPPHTGYEQVPDRYRARYKNLNVDSIIASWPSAANLEPSNRAYLKESLADYYACMSGVDEQVGRIVAALAATGDLNNTIVVFTSDHGDMMGMHNHIGKNIFYEESMRVPMIISAPGRLAARMDGDLLISLEDLCPTLLSMMGFKDRIPSSVQTRDLSAQVRGSRSHMPSSQLYMSWDEDDGRLLSTRHGMRGIRTARYTYAQRASDGKIVEEYLFDRRKDPYQKENIASRHTADLVALRGELRLRLEKIGDRWLENSSDGDF